MTETKKSVDKVFPKLSQQRINQRISFFLISSEISNKNVILEISRTKSNPYSPLSYKYDINVKSCKTMKLLVRSVFIQEYG
jgi:hypothetical protein